MNRNGQVGILIFVVFMVLVFAVILLVILLHGRSEPDSVDILNVSVNKTYYNITIFSNADKKVSYVLSNSSQVFVKGFLFPRFEEHYYGLEANKSVKLEVFSGDYYYNSVNCNITRNNFPCGLRLKEKALDYSIFLSSSVLVIDTRGKVLQSPVLLCWIEQSNVQNVVMDLKLVSVPVDLKSQVDFCYSYSKDIVNMTSFPIDVHLNDLNDDGVPKLLKVLIRDFERDKYSNVGDKVEGVLV